MSLFRKTSPTLSPIHPHAAHTTCFLLSTSDNWSLRGLYNLSARPPDSLGPSTSEAGADCVGTPSSLPRLWLPVEFISWGTGRRWEAGRKVSFGVFILLAPCPTWSPWVGCVPSLKASVAAGGPLHRHIISFVQKLPFPFGPLGLEVVPMPSLNTAHASRNIPSSGMKCDHASSPAGSPASCLASSCPPVPDPRLCGDWHRLCSLLTPRARLRV